MSPLIGRFQRPLFSSLFGAHVNEVSLGDNLEVVRAAMSSRNDEVTPLLLDVPFLNVAAAFVEKADWDILGRVSRSDGTDTKVLALHILNQIGASLESFGQGHLEGEQCNEDG